MLNLQSLYVFEINLGIGNVSPSTSPAELESLFAAHGKVESCRVLTHKNCGFVNFVTIQDAINARKNMNGKLINGGAIKINFAKVPEKSDFASLKPNAFRQLRSRNTPPSSSSGSPYSSTHSSSTLPRMESSSSSYSSSRMETTTPTSITTSPQKIADLFESCRIESDVSGLKINYATCIPSLPDVPTNRQIDQLRLREIRRKLDTNLTTKEMESLVDECLDQIVDLSIDYIGNVVVQKLMEYSQDSYRLLIIEHLSSSIAGVGIHKNGTWASILY